MSNTDMLEDMFIDLLRHGEPVGGGCFRGSQDDVLSERGFAQLDVATGQAGQWKCIVSSPLRRCCDYAKQLSGQLNIPLLIDNELAERHFGQWEGLQAQDIPAEELAQFWQNPVMFNPQGSEVFEDFVTRSIRVWARLKQQPYQHILVITHGGVIRSMIGHILKMPTESLVLLEVPYANMSRIRVPNGDQGQASLMFHRSES